MRAALLLIPLALGTLWVVRERAASSESRAATLPAETPPEPAMDAERADPHAACTERIDELLARITRLEVDLAAARADALEREQSWIEYNRMIVSIAPEDVFPELHAKKIQEALAEQAVPPEPDPDQLALEERSRRIHVSLNVLFRAEGIDAFDLLEVGLVQDGSIGPVLMRSFDDRGRAIGTITAARLRLEGSRSGRTLTVVLEDGYTRRSGERKAFPGSDTGAERGGVMRMVIPHTNPDAWSRAVPELFSEDHTQEILDDGRWNLFLLRRELNVRLDRSGLGGRYVLKDVDGVRDNVLRNVALDELGETGTLRRRLFADRMSVRVDERGVQLLLEDGVAVRGDQKVPFLDGRMRIFLPRADLDDWTDGSLPVIDSRAAEASEGEAPAGDGTESGAGEATDGSEPSELPADPVVPSTGDESSDSTDSALPR